MEALKEILDNFAIRVMNASKDVMEQEKLAWLRDLHGVVVAPRIVMVEEDGTTLGMEFATASNRARRSFVHSISLLQP